jgi:superfamily II DNA or RNA helicase/HKD family nuclease
MDVFKVAIQKSLTTGFVDANFESLVDYRPAIVTNEPISNEKVLSTILDELRSCESFFLSAAFITSGGVASLFGTLLDLEAKGVKGKILVSEYLNFTEPEALKKILQFSNVELRISRDLDFHSKGFLFVHKSFYTIIIGSSNITQSALTKNKEWNLKVTAHVESELAHITLNEFESVFNKSQSVTLEYIEKYSIVYSLERRLGKELRTAVIGKDLVEVSPNRMQIMALESLKALRQSGEKKALIVSATGTGKTYLSAFDVAAVNPRRLLFLVHRRNIAQKAMESFQQILKEKKKFGLYSGSSTDENADYIFSTIQTFSREDHLSKFNANHFDYIVIDETHRAIASSYKKILDHFKPNFLLGMTATPERTDGADVFALFNYNIASEIRLHDALSNDMLAPFHYFGISDIEVDGKILDENATINQLNRVSRVNHIIEKLKLFGTDDGVIRGLIFCSKQEECVFLSSEFNMRGFRTVALTANSTEDERSNAIDLLESEDPALKLDYIFTRDIFNEGVDIPRVNQIVMLRPTQSAIVFVQQLGRGLRKAKGKSYVTVIDFIANYRSNFLVPIALFGDKTFVKDNLRKLVHRPEKSIVGASTIYFERIVKDKIFQSIDLSNIQTKKNLIEDFALLRAKIGRIPKMCDFLLHGERDPFQYITEYKSYYAFLLNMNENVAQIDLGSLNLLAFLSKEVLNPIRWVDVFLFKKLIIEGEFSLSDFESNYNVQTLTCRHAIDTINGLFHTTRANGKMVKVGVHNGYNVVEVKNGLVVLGKTSRDLLKLNDVRDYLLDLCDYSLKTLDSAGDCVYKNDFILYNRYTRKDTFRILQWSEKPIEQNVGGYMIERSKRDCALFVTYHKDESISSSIKYHDRFISKTEFIWVSKNKRKLNSPDIETILKQSQLNLRIPLFVQKSNSEGIEFYYLGNLRLQENSAVEKIMKDGDGKDVSVVEITFNLMTPVESDLYDYIVNA